MPRVEVTLNGKPYALACEDGQEPRLRELAAYVDSRLRQLSGGAPVGGESQWLALMTLVLADELFDMQAELQAVRTARRTAETAAAPPAPAPAPPDLPAEKVADAVETLAKRIEDIAARLERA
ncbi:cell division protein ZapA [Oleisolibacter albus]|uniref:cell division protein ZapA n=1 Tax=Oleisolibacter albus TaxID=2171757 RepID=UPI000DF477B2|nr:cell division protein ZapA [Oleisolibacter albus]